jgi:hypothetical protein
MSNRNNRNKSFFSALLHRFIRYPWIEVDASIFDSPISTYVHGYSFPLVIPLPIFSLICPSPVTKPNQNLVFVSLQCLSLLFFRMESSMLTRPLSFYTDHCCNSDSCAVALPSCVYAPRRHQPRLFIFLGPQQQS